ncbi:hypothetical protein AVEN_12803-1 [Araneus ventricosus]|uniref:Uncharacterized protein n=1 Tax=Araneus ventricosus TaxID=182803 RepID=A0A4Y2ABJ7_ARAVE|nr:hypothetical protein AVEN_12803-1 [Araneus ventricosus]
MGVIGTPSLQPDFAPSDFHLFGLLKNHLGGRFYRFNATAQQAVLSWLHDLVAGFFYAGFDIRKGNIGGNNMYPLSTISTSNFKRVGAFRMKVIMTDETKRGRGGLVVRSRLLNRRAPASKPDSIEDPPYMRVWRACNMKQMAKRPPADVVWKLREEVSRFKITRK